MLSRKIMVFIVNKYQLLLNGANMWTYFMLYMYVIIHKKWVIVNLGFILLGHRLIWGVGRAHGAPPILASLFLTRGLVPPHSFCMITEGMCYPPPLMFVILYFSFLLLPGDPPLIYLFLHLLIFCFSHLILLPLYSKIHDPPLLGQQKWVAANFWTTWKM